MKRRSSKENGVVGISCKKGRKRSMLMSPLIRLPNAKPPKKHKEGITLLSPLNKSAFFLPLSLNFINVLIVSQKILHRARGFCFFRGVRDIPVKSTNFFQTCWISMTKVEKKKQQQTNKNIKNAWKRYIFLIACNLRLFVHSSSSPKRKY